MVLRRRRYQSLGLLRRSQSRRGKLEGVEKFVSESQLNEVILYNRVTRARPFIKQLELASDDVDWPLEYFCGLVGKWMKSLVTWLLGILESFMRFLGFRRKEPRDKNDDAGGGYGERMNPTRFSYLDHSGGDARFSQPKMSLRHPETFWRFEKCVPFLRRRILKRKWFLNPATREWAEGKELLFQKHVTRGFRTLCSAAGKDIKIYVVCSQSESDNFHEPSSPSSPQTFIFRADSSVLKANSKLFRQWFEIPGNDEKIVTSFVTPREMQAILVYMYTLTWPMDMLVPQEEGGKRTLCPKFLAILSLYGMSLSLVKETPPANLIGRTNYLQVTNGPHREKDKNQNISIVNERDVLKPVTSVSSEGQGDCSQELLQTTGVFKCVTEKVSGTNYLPPSAPVTSPSSSDRGVKVRNRAIAMQTFKIPMSNSSNRVYPETTAMMSLRNRSIKSNKSSVVMTHLESAKTASEKNIDEEDTTGFHIG